MRAIGDTDGIVGRSADVRASPALRSARLAETMPINAHRRCNCKGEKQGGHGIGAITGCKEQAGTKTGDGNCGAEQAIHVISGLGCDEDDLVYLLPVVIYTAPDNPMQAHRERLPLIGREPWVAAGRLT